MWLDKMLRFKGLTFGTLGLLALFIAYLALSFGLQAKVQTESNYAMAVIGLSDRVSLDLSLPETARVLKGMEAFRTGDSVRVAGKSINTYALSEFLSPAASQLEILVQHLRADTLTSAVESAQALSATVERRLNSKIKAIYYLKLAVGIIALSIYLLLVVPKILRLSEDENSDSSVESETKENISSVSEGLFILDHDYQIRFGTSASLKRLFKMEDDLRGNFFNFIKQYVSTHTVKKTHEFLDEFDDGQARAQEAIDVNPLREVEIIQIQHEGHIERRYLQFQFDRVNDQNKVGQFYVSVTDQTQRVLLTRELKATKQEQTAQMELLLQFLRIDQRQLASFLSSTETGLESANSILKGSGHSDNGIRRKLDDVSLAIEKMIIDAQVLGLNKFEVIALRAKKALFVAKSREEALNGQSVLPIVIELRNLFCELKHMQNTHKKMEHENPFAMVNDTDEMDAAGTFKKLGLATELQELAKTVSERNNKRVHLSLNGLRVDQLPDALHEAFKIISIQLVRNSIVHGSTMPLQRLDAGKTDYLNVIVSLNESDNAYTLLVRDDGEGLNNLAILERAVELGIIKREHFDRIVPEQAFKLIFHRGFSQLSEENADGGCGLGLDAIRSMAKELGGAISVRYKQGFYCQFNVTIPKPGESIEPMSSHI